MGAFQIVVFFWIASQACNDKQKKHPPAPFKGGTLFVIFACLKTCFLLGSRNDKPTFSHTSPSFPVICSASKTDTLIDYQRNVLNEVKNRIVTKGKPAAEILHFVQNDMAKVTFFSCHFCLFDAIFGGSQRRMTFTVIASLRSNPENM